jgi:pSer/pThr/pTyr-binding forkhead associated (FHA) protein
MFEIVINTSFSIVEAVMSEVTMVVLLFLGPLVVLAVLYFFWRQLNLGQASKPNYPTGNIPTGGGEYGRPQTFENGTLPPQIEARLVMTHSRVPQLQHKVFNLHHGYHCLGRNPIAQAQVQSLLISEDQAISEMHAYLILQNAEQMGVEVLGKHGLWVNGTAFREGAKTLMRPGDTITMGNTTFQFQVGQTNTSHKTYTGTKRLDRQPASAPAVHLQIVTGSGQGKSISVTNRLIMGRSSKAGWQLNDQKISREHAEIRRDTAGFTLTDLNSSHGVFVNGQQVHRRTLETGDRIRLGDTEILVTLSV